MGNVKVSSPRVKYYSGINSELYSSSINWNILSLEVKEEEQSTYEHKESIMDELEIIAIRNHSLHNRDREEVIDYKSEDKRKEEDSKVFNTTDTSNKTYLSIQRVVEEHKFEYTHDSSEVPLDEVQSHEIHHPKSSGIVIKSLRLRNPCIRLSSTMSSFSSSQYRIIEQTVDSPKTKFHYGFVYRYHLTATPKCIKRIAEANTDCLCYFKTNHSYWLAFPLMVIKYKDMLKIKQIKNELLNTTQSLFEITYKESADVKIETVNAILSNKASKQKKAKVYTVNAISFTTKHQALNYIDYIKKNNKMIRKKYELNGIKDNKRIEKVVLGVDTPEECEKWVGLLSWAAQLNQ